MNHPDSEPARKYTADDMAMLLNTVVAGIATGINELKLFSLEEVAELTGFSLKQLQTDCQNDVIEHTWRGRTRGLTARQISILMRRHARGGDLAGRPRTDMELAVAATRQTASRQKPRRAAA